MISQEEKDKINTIAKKYHAKKVLLFGSSINSQEKVQDIDLAVEGIEDKDFFNFCGELLFSLSKPVDLVDLSKKSRFTEFVERKGIVIYG